MEVAVGKHPLPWLSEMCAVVQCPTGSSLRLLEGSEGSGSICPNPCLSLSSR
jgi:hypothetical protein